MATKTYRAATAAVILTALATTSCSKKEKTADATVPEIDVAEVMTDSVTIYKTYPGRICADNSVDVVGRVNGTLLTKQYEGGDLVKKGQILFTIEDQTYRDAVAQAEAQLATARSQNEYSTKQYAAMKKALESDAVSQMEVLSAKNSMESSAAAIKEAEAALSTARIDLNNCVVRAPITGHISTNTESVGTWIEGGGAPVVLATIYDDAYVNANFYIEDVSLLEMFTHPEYSHGLNFKAIPIRFSESLPHDYTGDMTYMAPSVDSSTGTLLVQAKIRNEYNELRDGMYTEVSLPWEDDPKAMLVKDAAISTDQLGKYLYIVSDSDKVVYTPVEVGDLYQDTLRVILSGINPGDRYVTKALLKVRDGMTVKPVMTR
ncbi:MAG: efflux RND transporter periplasmic adaptor subunit [Clostridium sp.]|nr:efflux RND transporter periplasmic adaptor subunit [Clostridium sp.]